MNDRQSHFFAISPGRGLRGLRRLRAQQWTRSAIGCASLLLAAACATIAPSPDAARVLAPTGTLRIGVYPGSATSLVRGAGGDARGVSVDVGRALAERLRVPYELVEFPRPAEVVAGIKDGKADFTITNATAARAREIDFTGPVIAIESGFLVPPASRFASIDDVDRDGVRIGVTQGSTTSASLPARLKKATMVTAPDVDTAIAMLKDGRADAYATQKAVLFGITDKLPGSRVLDGHWGVERMAIAYPKGRDGAKAYLDAFATDASREGIVARAAERAGLRGLAAE